MNYWVVGEGLRGRRPKAGRTDARALDGYAGGPPPGARTGFPTGFPTAGGGIWRENGQIADRAARKREIRRGR